MERVKMIDYDSANAEQKAAFREQVEKHGRMTNMKKTLLNHMPSFYVLMKWYELRDLTVKLIGEFSTNLFAYAVSDANDCLICSTFFRKILIDSGYDPDNLKLSETDAALYEFARAAATHAEVTEELFGRLKRYFDDSGIVLLTAFAGQMIATNLVNNMLKVPLDEYLVPYTKR
ncbi:MAG TPA: hypothetical protein P5161_01305 [Eubacteriales bacterium]|jgi:alkylhydroperoxidase family enzyme|nr:hypothetical protein [Eubacteriales bacterium]HRU83941.1 hypothetical protein [Eubacteriales bacterium]